MGLPMVRYAPPPFPDVLISAEPVRSLRVFMNDEPFDQDFIDGVKSITRSEVHFYVIPKEHWSYPEWINKTYAAEERQKMVDENVICAISLLRSAFLCSTEPCLTNDSVERRDLRWGQRELSTHVPVQQRVLLSTGNPGSV